MASTFGATTTCGLTAAPTSFATNKKLSLFSRPSISVPHSVHLQRRCNVRVNVAKELHFNKDGSAIKKLQVATVIREEEGLSLDKADTEVLGAAAKVVLTKDTTTIAGDGTTHEEVNRRAAQIKNQIEEYEKEKLNERIAKLSGGVAVFQVSAQTETELKEKKLRVEDALNATKAAVEESIVVGGGCTLLRLATS